MVKTCFSPYGLDAFPDAMRTNRCRQNLLAGIESHIYVWQPAPA